MLKLMTRLAMLLAVGFFITSCGAIGKQLKKGVANAKAAEDAGWKLDKSTRFAQDAAVAFLAKQNDGAKPTVDKTGGGPFNDEQRIHMGSLTKSEKWEMVIFTPRKNGGIVPDTGHAQLSKVVFQEFHDKKWQDVKSGVMDLFIEQYRYFLDHYKP